SLTYDRQTAARLGISAQLIDDTLYDAFGQRQVSTMFTSLNQYHVVMEVDPQYWQSPTGLDSIYIRPNTTAASVAPSLSPTPTAARISSITLTTTQPTPTVSAATTSSPAVTPIPASAVLPTPGTLLLVPTTSPTPAPCSFVPAPQATPASNAVASTSDSGGRSTPTPSPTPVVPLRAIARYQPTTAPIAVNHQGQFPSVTISFNLAGGTALSDAVAAIQQMQQRIAMPGTVHGSFSGTAQVFQTSLAGEPFLILAALVAVY